LIKILLYFTILLSGVAFFYVGANVGYNVGEKAGIDEAIIYGITIGKVTCHYIKKPECNKRECKVPVYSKTESPFDHLFPGRQTWKEESGPISPAGWYFKLQDSFELVRRHGS
jgi:hypothetical protein